MTRNDVRTGGAAPAAAASAGESTAVTAEDNESASAAHSCSNCGLTNDPQAYYKHPRLPHLELCSECYGYSCLHGGRMRPPSLWEQQRTLRLQELEEAERGFKICTNCQTTSSENDRWSLQRQTRLRLCAKCYDYEAKKGCPRPMKLQLRLDQRRREAADGGQGRCSNCGRTEEAGHWSRHPSTHTLLCQACYGYGSKNGGAMRPQELWGRHRPRTTAVLPTARSAVQQAAEAAAEAGRGGRISRADSRRQQRQAGPSPAQWQEPLGGEAWEPVVTLAEALQALQQHADAGADAREASEQQQLDTRGQPQQQQQQQGLHHQTTRQPRQPGHPELRAAELAAAAGGAESPGEQQQAAGSSVPPAEQWAEPLGGQAWQLPARRAAAAAAQGRVPPRPENGAGRDSSQPAEGMHPQEQQGSAGQAQHTNAQVEQGMMPDAGNENEQARQQQQQRHEQQKQEEAAAQARRQRLQQQQELAAARAWKQRLQRQQQELAAARARERRQQQEAERRRQAALQKALDPLSAVLPVLRASVPTPPAPTLGHLLALEQEELEAEQAVGGQQWQQVEAEGLADWQQPGYLASPAFRPRPTHARPAGNSNRHVATKRQRGSGAPVAGMFTAVRQDREDCRSTMGQLAVAGEAEEREGSTGQVAVVAEEEELGWWDGWEGWGDWESPSG